MDIVEFRPANAHVYRIETGSSRHPGTEDGDFMGVDSGRNCQQAGSLLSFAFLTSTSVVVNIYVRAGFPPKHCYRFFDVAQ